MRVPVIATLVLLWVLFIVKHTGGWAPLDYVGALACLINVIYASVATWKAEQ